jgi:hypothetical protein
MKSVNDPSTNKYESLIHVDLIPSKPLHIYCNNIFALQIYTHSQFYTDSKHTYICNSSKHQIHDFFNNQNLYFRIQCKKCTNIITIHFHDILIPQMIQLDEIYDYMIYIFSPNALLRSKFKVPFSEHLLKEF